MPLSKREKFLLNITFWILLASLSFLFLFFKEQERRGYQNQIPQLESALQQIQDELMDIKRQDLSFDAHEAEYKTLTRKLYAPNEIDTYKFGSLITALLVKLQLKIERTSTIESHDKIELDFVITGNAVNLFRFLKAVYEGEKFWNISLFSVKSLNLDGNTYTIFRINYEQQDLPHN